MAPMMSYIFVLSFLVITSIRNLLWSEEKEINRVKAIIDNPHNWKLPILASVLSVTGGLIVYNSANLLWPILWKVFGIVFVILGFVVCFILIFQRNEIQKFIANAQFPSSAAMVKRTVYKRLSAIPIFVIAMLWGYSGVGTII